MTTNSDTCETKLAISIVIWGQENEAFLRTLCTLDSACACARSAGRLGSARLVLTDHSPQAASAERISRWQQSCSAIKLDYLHDAVNPGFGAGHNAAFSRLNGCDLFLVANPDLEFSEDSLLGALIFFSDYPRVGVLSPLLVEDNGERPGCFRPPSIRGLFVRWLGFTAQQSQWVARYECRDWDINQPVMNPPMMSGCCMMFRSEIFGRLGGFDPGYFLYFEDFDLSLRAGTAGVSAYCPMLRVVHTGGGASRKGTRHQLYFVRSAWRFFNTHGWRW